MQAVSTLSVHALKLAWCAAQAPAAQAQAAPSNAGDVPVQQAGDIQGQAPILGGGAAQGGNQANLQRILALLGRRLLAA